MTTYNEIAGRRVNFLSSDPTYVDTNSDGQVWYNSSTATLKSWLPTGAFSAGGNLNTGRSDVAGAGTQSAALAFGGYGPTAATEAYNGIAWTNQNSLGTAGYRLAGAGTQTSAVAIGGFQRTTSTEKWNGTSWTASGSLNTARTSPAAAGVSNSSALAFGGNTSQVQLQQQQNLLMEQVGHQ
jgi:hypothetical protein